MNSANANRRTGNANAYGSTGNANAPKYVRSTEYNNITDEEFKTLVLSIQSADEFSNSCKRTISPNANSRLFGMSSQNPNVNLAGTEYCINLPSGCYNVTTETDETKKGYFCEYTREFKYDHDPKQYYIKWNKKTSITTANYNTSGVSQYLKNVDTTRNSWDLVIYLKGNSTLFKIIDSMIPVSESCTTDNEDCGNNKSQLKLNSLSTTFYTPSPNVEEKKTVTKIDKQEQSTTIDIINKLILNTQN
jgi:hypothetical protein